MDNTIIQQGSFTADGNNLIISLRSDIDWMRVYNLTELAAQNDESVIFFWQREQVAAGVDGIRWFKSGGSDNIEVITMTADEFSLIDSSTSLPGAAVATTAGSDVVQPIINTGTTSGLATGSIVRLMNTANWLFLGGVDIEIDTVTPATNFRFRFALDRAPGTIQGAGEYRIIPFDPIYYPRRRNIFDITAAAQAVVRFSVTHGYTVGQSIRFNVEAAFGMVELDGLVGNIVAVSTANNTVTVDIDTTGFTAFASPLSATSDTVTWAHVVPLGMDTAQALASSVDILADATENLSVLGMELVAGANQPAGQNNDVITWIAGKSFATGL